MRQQMCGLPQGGEVVLERLADRDGDVHLAHQFGFHDPHGLAIENPARPRSRRRSNRPTVRPESGRPGRPSTAASSPPPAQPERHSRRVQSRSNRRRLSRRPNDERNDGHIRGFRMVGFGGAPGVVDGGRGACDSRELVHCRNFSMPRLNVDQLSRGGRVPMVLTQTTGRRGSRRTTRCWQLDGCRPQSSENTISGATSVTGMSRSSG